MRAAISTKLVVLFSMAVLCSACATKGPGPMYMWDTFPSSQYQSLIKEGASPEEQIRTLQAHAEKASGANASLPPGFRAHLGMLHLSAGNPGEARKLWEAEKAAFPESSVFIDSLLKKLSASEKPVKSEKAA